MTAIVIDANISLAQVLPLPYSLDVVRQMDVWRMQRSRLVVPALWEYEVASGLRRACMLGMLTPDQANEALEIILGMAFEVVVGTPAGHRRALLWAERLGQARAYDAQYLVLAEQIEAEFWTADRRLVQSARQLHVAWVHWVGEE